MSTKIVYFLTLTLTPFLSFSIWAIGPMCNPGSTVSRLISSSEVIKIHVMGQDDRKPQEEFGNPEYLEAQRVLGRQEIEKSISGVVGVKCRYKDKSNGKTYSYNFNGILVCDKKTLLVNTHSLVDPLCNNANPDFDCKVQPGKHHPEESKILKPDNSQIMTKDFCNQPVGGTDVAIVKLENSSSRTPLKIGTVTSFEQIEERKFVSIAANTSDNYVDQNGNRIPTEKTFTLSQFDKIDSPQSTIARSATDGGSGSSGEAHLISQDQEPLVIGFRIGAYAPADSEGYPIDGYAYDKETNHTRSMFFQKDVQDFIRPHIEEPNKCFKNVEPENSVST